MAALHHPCQSSLQRRLWQVRKYFAQLCFCMHPNEGWMKCHGEVFNYCLDTEESRMKQHRCHKPPHFHCCLHERAKVCVLEKHTSFSYFFLLNHEGKQAQADSYVDDITCCWGGQNNASSRSWCPRDQHWCYWDWLSFRTALCFTFTLRLGCASGCESHLLPGTHCIQ